MSDDNNILNTASDEQEERYTGNRRTERDAPRGKLNCFDWLSDIPGSMAHSDLVEVQFKNTRKGFYRNTTGLDLSIGDMVAVEAAPGHDIGRVTLTGQLVILQMKRAGFKSQNDLKRVFRLARQVDLEKYEEAKARENDTMIRARHIAEELNLNMKIGDVEYQGDGNKAIFYYIADERVDFRQLIKVLAETFKVRIEMKQIGARQEAGRIGGIGPCGRPLCCASWMTNFVTVGTAAARFQDISLNPQKLAGQCAKLKCCLNFEVDSYVESMKKLPGREIRLETKDSTYYFFKYDIFGGTITYSTDKSIPANLITIDAARAFEIIEMNKQGEKPDTLSRDGAAESAQGQQYNDILSQDISRFDKKKRKRKGKETEKPEKAEKVEKPVKPEKTEKPAKERPKEQPKEPVKESVKEPVKEQESAADQPKPKLLKLKFQRPQPEKPEQPEAKPRREKPRRADKPDAAQDQADKFARLLKDSAGLSVVDNPSADEQGQRRRGRVRRGGRGGQNGGGAPSESNTNADA